MTFQVAPAAGQALPEWLEWIAESSDDVFPGTLWFFIADTAVNPGSCVVVTATDQGDGLSASVAFAALLAADQGENPCLGVVPPPPGDDESLSTAVTLRVSPEEVSEGAGIPHAGDRDRRVEWRLPRTADTVVTVSVTAGTATAVTDFSVSNVTPLTIATGQVRGTATFTLTPVDDNIDEPAETVTVEGSTTVMGGTDGRGD